MLQKVGRKRARVPLTREGVNSTLLHADRWVGMDEVCGLASANDVSAIGYFRVGSAYVASRISPAIALRSSLATSECGVYLAVSSSQG